MPRTSVLGTTGKTYLFSGANDAGYGISAYWRSKNLDFSEELGIEATQILKTIDKVALLYEDIDSNMPITISISADGGNTWTSKSATIGTGAGGSRRYEIDFVPTDAVTGHIITVKVECPSSNKSIKWNGISVDIILRGVKSLMGED